MKPICVLYATREGHTQKIAEHLGSALQARGLLADVRNVQDRPEDFHPDSYSAIILAASVHQGHHESEMLRFVRKHRDELAKLRSAFLSVSLNEAGAERTDTTPEQHARFVSQVEQVLEDFFHQAEWRPTHVRAVAGALPYSKYNFLVRVIMKRIAAQSGIGTDTSRDYEYTDWVALDRFTEELAAELSPSIPADSAMLAEAPTTGDQNHVSLPANRFPG